MSRLAALFQIAVVAAVAAFAFSDTAGPSRRPTAYLSDFTPESIQRVSAFPLYWVGTRFGDWPLVAIDGPLPPDGFITFTYGTGAPRPQDEEASCGAPLLSPVERNLRVLGGVLPA